MEKLIRKSRLSDKPPEGAPAEGGVGASQRSAAREVPSPGPVQHVPGREVSAAGTVPHGAYSALAVSALAFVWFGVIVGLFIASNVRQPTDGLAELLELNLARLQLFTRIEVGISLAVGVAQLYARIGRLAWIVYGCVLAALLAEIGWLQPLLVAEVGSLKAAAPADSTMTHTLHQWLDAGRAAGLLGLGLVGFKLTAERTVGGQR